MGIVVHRAIVVTSWKESLLIELANRARALDVEVLGPSAAVLNGYRTLVLCPCGSNEGWADDAANRDARCELKDWMDTQRYEDGSTSLEWTEIAYGNDMVGREFQSAVTDDTWRRR